LSIVDNAYILIDGVIFKQGSADDLANDEEVKKLYLGEKFKLDRYG
jgi:lipopolysaccharide export system ATP-binding protein